MENQKNGYFLAYEKLADLLNELRTQGYRCVGPQVRDDAIIYDDLESVEQLPWGIKDEQKPGSYRLIQTEKTQAFAWANSAQAIKPLLFKPKELLWKVQKNLEGRLVFQQTPPQPELIALIGVRSCDLAAMAVQDKVFIQDKYVDERYKAQRERLFIIAVNCSYSGGNCFCVSTGDGPEAKQGFDIAMTEIDHGFVITQCTSQAEKIITALKLASSTALQIEQSQQGIARAIQMQTKKMPSVNVRDVLFANLDHPRWDNVAERCLSCGNCTSVCPTCFCHTETEKPTLDGACSEHGREWDSCFTAGQSYIHDTVIRDTTKARYKQWLTHKLASWWDQFDTSGCIGCGRCVTWCPVGIDLTEEIAAISGESNQVSAPEKNNE